MGALRLSYFIRVPNVGDLVNPHLIARLTGLPVVRASGDSPHLLAIGSLLGWATPNSHIWGTGMLNASTDLDGASRSLIHAVRGMLSLQRLRQAGARIGDVPLGDPGILVPNVLGIARSAIARHRVGLVCHHTDRYHPVLRRFMREDGVLDISVHLPPKDFLEKMAGCETILSTSLHGLIFAEALGLPNLWIKGYGQAVVDDFKFNDWFSTTDRPQKVAHVVAHDDEATVLARRAVLHDSTIDARALTKALPRQYFDEIRGPAGRLMLTVDICRTHPLPVFVLRGDKRDDLRQFAEDVRRVQPVDLILLDAAATETDKLHDAILTDVRVSRAFDLPGKTSPDYFDAINVAILDYFSAWAEPACYVLSDCNIDLSCLRVDAFLIFAELLKKHRAVECVGPTIRVRHATPQDEAKNGDLRREADANWRQLSAIEPVLDRQVETLHATIGTDFALHRAGERVRPDKRALRTCEPYEAQAIRYEIVRD